MDIQRPLSKQPIPPHAKKVFSGKIFEIYQWEQKLFNGKTAVFEKARRPCDSVNVLPVTKNGKILLSKQEQPGSPPFIGAFGGRMEPGETPLDTAKRELLEESGLVADEFILFDAISWDIKVDWVIYTFIAKELQVPVEQRPDAGEKIAVIEVTFEEYLELVLQENYRDTELTFKLLKAEKDPVEFARIKKLFEAG